MFTAILLTIACMVQAVQRSGHAARTLQKVQDERSDVTETGYERYEMLDAKKGIILLGCCAADEALTHTVVMKRAVAQVNIKSDTQMTGYSKLTAAYTLSLIHI